MTQIGSFQRTRHGYEGRLHTLTLDCRSASFRLTPAKAITRLIGAFTSATLRSGRRSARAGTAPARRPVLTSRY